MLLKRQFAWGKKTYIVQSLFRDWESVRMSTPDVTLECVSVTDSSSSSDSSSTSCTTSSARFARRSASTSSSSGTSSSSTSNSSGTSSNSARSSCQFSRAPCTPPRSCLETLQWTFYGKVAPVRSS